MKSQSFDEDAIRDYCLHHELNRPDISIPKLCAVTGGILVVTVAISYSFHCLTGFSFWLLAELVFCLCVLCLARKILIILIKCYQRFAPEHVRRQCSCIPLCSEYALMVLEKRPWPIAVWKIWKRVTDTCMQPGYHIDYP